jgi:predicted DNA-binding antitoxin AbrB/MazE fold protein
MDTIIAIYEQGVLRPLTELSLVERTRVRLQIIEEVDDEAIEYPLLALANLGESSEQDISERAEDILADEINPNTGWSSPDANHR